MSTGHIPTVYGMFPCGNLKRNKRLNERAHEHICKHVRTPTSYKCAMLFWVFSELLWAFYQFDSQPPCSVIWDSSCYHNKLLSPRIWKCSTPTGGWWYTGTWNSTQLVPMCGCLWMGALSVIPKAWPGYSANIYTIQDSMRPQTKTSANSQYPWPRYTCTNGGITGRTQVENS